MPSTVQHKNKTRTCLIFEKDVIGTSIAGRDGEVVDNWQGSDGKQAR
jgi:hypothetical protein